ncbi:MAG: NAD(P)/FAD-dependent oxidoreductase [Deltaproteobacteria bacterium]|nr:NAD(P)/FAD-dependent oxidoreductase [Deltaproteobacteria bacterium]
MYDAILIGGGHNGLTAAAYLARAGLRVIVLERREILGGTCVTEELWPGFKISRAAYVAGLLRPAVVEELGLLRRGLKLLPRRPSSWTPDANGPGLLFGRDEAANLAQIRHYSPRDAERMPAYERVIDRAARVIEPLLDAPPFDPAHPRLADLGPLLKALRAGIALRSDLTEALALVLGSATNGINRWFESEPLRSTLATDALIGAHAGPSTPGTGYVLFHHLMGDTGGARGVWAYVEGGMGGLSAALADAAREAGAEIRTNAEVRRIGLRGGRACAVELADGASLEARAIVSSIDPYHTLQLLGREHAPAEFASTVDATDFRSPVVKINLALDSLPVFHACPDVREPGPWHQGTIHLGAGTMDELDASFSAAERGELPEKPMIELTVPSAVDPTLAPRGKYVASLFVQHAPPRATAEFWEKNRERFADRVLACIDELSPGFSRRVVHRDVLTPLDLERVFGIRGGNIFHGAMTLDRLGPMRPAPGWSRYATPLPGFFLCGAATHPGGGVMGACGRNAAKVIAESLRAER